MSFQVTIYSDREKAEFRRKHFRPLETQVSFHEEEHKTGPFGGAYVKGAELRGLVKSPSNIQSAKEWFETCLWVVQNVKRYQGHKDTGRRGMSEEEFRLHFSYTSAKGFVMPVNLGSASSHLAHYRLMKRIAVAMGWQKTVSYWEDQIRGMKAATSGRA